MNINACLGYWMKRYVIHIIFLFICISEGLMGQSTYRNPFPGSTHSYNATVTDIGNDNPVRWIVATNTSGSARAVHGIDFTFDTDGYNSVNNQLEGVAVYQIQITWGVNVLEATNFYIFLEVDDNATGCTNKMAMHVQITDDFNAYVIDVTHSSFPGNVETGPFDDIDEETCPDDVIDPIWDGDGHSNIGFSEIVYRIGKQFSLYNWQFEYNFTERTGKPFILENIRMVNQDLIEIYDGTAQSGVLSVEEANYVLVYIKITNEQNVRFDFDLELITTNDLTYDISGNLDSNTTDNIADHTILPMPEITGFGGN